MSFEPFYIGFGHGTRMYQHIAAARRIKKLDCTNNTYKNIVLKKLIELGLEPIYTVLAKDLDADTAKDAERFWIAHFGRRDIKTGISGNLTDGGDGISNISEETRRRMSDSHKGKMPSNINEFRTLHLKYTKEEHSQRMTKAALSKNDGVRKPGRERVFPGLSRSEVSHMRELQKDDIQKDQIRKKISEAKRGSIAHNRIFPLGSIEHARILLLYSIGVSVKNICEIEFGGGTYQRCASY